MKIAHLLAAVLAALAVFGCRPSNFHLPVERYTAESPTSYRYETGTITDNGFIPQFAKHCTYSDSGPSAKDVARANGKLVLSLGIWEQAKKYTKHRRTGETLMIKEVPHVVIKE